MATLRSLDSTPNCALITPRAYARSGVKQWVLSVSQCVCHQNLGLITTTKGLNTSKRHSNNDNSEKRCTQRWLKRSYSGEFPAICGRSLVPRLRHESGWGRDYRGGAAPRIHGASLVPSLSARQMFIAYSMKNRRGKSGSKRHDAACRNVTEASCTRCLFHLRERHS